MASRPVLLSTQIWSTSTSLRPLPPRRAVLGARGRALPGPRRPQPWLLLSPSSPFSSACRPRWLRPPVRLDGPPLQPQQSPGEPRLTPRGGFPTFTKWRNVTSPPLCWREGGGRGWGRRRPLRLGGRQGWLPRSMEPLRTPGENETSHRRVLDGMICGEREACRRAPGQPSLPRGRDRTAKGPGTTRPEGARSRHSQCKDYVVRCQLRLSQRRRRHFCLSKSLPFVTAQSSARSVSPISRARSAAA